MNNQSESSTLLSNYLSDALKEFRRQKGLAEGGMVQVDDAGFFAQSDPESNSIAVIVKHVAGNLRSRWSDFLTSDGEKPDRNRDTEFELYEDESREELMERWEKCWQILFSTLESLQPENVEDTIKIRGEDHKVWQAIQRQLTHYAYHVGQIVYLSRAHRSGEWNSLSIPKGKSEEFNSGKNFR